MSYQERSLGAYVNLQHLAGYQLAARYLPLRKNNRALSHLSGPYQTQIRGRGMEFEDVRLYQPGDDIRTIDWRVTARTGKAHTKQFREEREKPVLVVVDQRQSMFFASHCAMKSVLAADFAAYIAWAALHKGDRVGGLIFNNQGHEEIRPRRQRKTVLQLLFQLSRYNQLLSSREAEPERPLNQILQELKRITKPGTQVFFISDFHDLDESSSALLHDLVRHNEIVALQIYDELEQQLPSRGLYLASNGHQQQLLDSNNKALQKNYHDTFAQRQQQLKALLGKFQIPCIPVTTQQAPLAVLQQYFGGKP